MFADKTILIVEENAESASNLASAVEGHNGTVAGPVSTIADAFALITDEPFSGAVVDADIEDVATLVEHLEKTEVPHVLQAASRLTPAVGKKAVMLYRPVDSSMVLSMLAIAIGKAAIR